MTDNVAAEYRRNLHRYQEAAKVAESLLTSLLNDESVNHLSVNGRAKDEDSFVKKASKTDDQGIPKYPSPLEQIQDMVGVRVITYLTADVERVLEIVSTHFDILETTDKGALTAARGEYGYSSHHLLARLAGPRAAQAEYASLRDLVIEVQVRTTLQHAWAEFEHDVRYKPNLNGAPQHEINRRFTLAAGLLELADAEFTRIDHLIRDTADPTAQPLVDLSAADQMPVTGGSLADFLGARHPEAPRSKQDHYDWIANLVVRAGIPTIGALEDAIGPTAADDDRTDSSAVRRLDDDLLRTLGDRWILANEGVGERRLAQLRARQGRN